MLTLRYGRSVIGSRSVESRLGDEPGDHGRRCDAVDPLTEADVNVLPRLRGEDDAGCRRRRGALRPHRRDPLMERAEADAFDPPAGLADALVDPARGVRRRHDHRVGGVALAGVPLGEQREDGVLVDHVAVGVDDHDTVRVAVVADPEGEPLGVDLGAGATGSGHPLVGVGDERPEVRRLSGVGLLPRPGKWPSMFPLSVTTSAPSSAGRSASRARTSRSRSRPRSGGRRDRPRTLRVRADRVEVAVEGVDALRLGPLVPRRRGLLARDAFSTARSASRSNSLPSRNSLIPLSVGGLCEAVSITPYRPCEACASAGVGSRPARSTRTPRTRGPTPSRPRSPDPSRVRHARGRPRRVSSPLQPLVLQPRRRDRRPTRAPVSLAFGATADPRGSEQVHISGVGRRSLEVVGCGSPSASRSNYDGPAVLTRRRTQPPPMTDRTRAHVYVSGRVQGVYYRATTRDTARGGASTAGSATSTTGASRPSSRDRRTRSARWSRGARWGVRRPMSTALTRRTRSRRDWTGSKCGGRL